MTELDDQACAHRHIEWWQNSETHVTACGWRCIDCDMPFGPTCCATRQEQAEIESPVAALAEKDRRITELEGELQRISFAAGNVAMHTGWPIEAQKALVASETKVMELAAVMRKATALLYEAYELVNDGSTQGKQWEAFKRVCAGISQLNQHDPGDILAEHSRETRRKILLEAADEIKPINPSPIGPLHYAGLKMAENHLRAMAEKEGA